MSRAIPQARVARPSPSRRRPTSFAPTKFEQKSPPTEKTATEN